MRTLKRDVFLSGILLLLPLLLFWPVTLGSRTLLPADILYTAAPYRAAAEEMGVTEVQNSLLADLILQNYPWKLHLVEPFHARELPLWNPYLFSGHPFLANGQHSGLYPLTWVSLLFPIPRAFGVFVTLQLGLAGISMYIMARVMRAARLGAFLAGITFQFSGFLVVSAVHPMIIAAATWLPLLLALIDLTVRRARFWRRSRAMLPWALLGAGVLGLHILAGHAEITYFALLVMGAFAAWRLVHTALITPRERWAAEVGSPALGLLLMVALGLGLGAVQLIPLYEVVSDSFRQGSVTLAEVLGWAYPKRRIITFLIPNFFGNPAHHTLWDFLTGTTLAATHNAHGQAISAFDWGIKNYVEGGAYLGVLPLLLAAVALLWPPGWGETSEARRPVPGAASARRERPRDGGLEQKGGVEQHKGFAHLGETLLARFKRWLAHPYIPFFTALSLFSLGCIFGTPIYALVYALPFLNQSHSPFRWVFPLTVAGAALAAFGATTVAEFRRARGPDAPSLPLTHHPSPRPKLLPRLLMFDTAPNVVSILGATALWSGLALWAGLWASRLAFPLTEPLVERAFWSLAKAAYAFPDHRAFYAYLFPWVQVAAACLIGAGIVLRVSRCPIYLPKRVGRRPAWEALAVGLLLVDLLTFGTGFNPAVDPGLLDYVPPVIEFLQQQPGPWRFSTFDPHGRRTFTANMGMLHGLQDVRGYDSLFSVQYARYMQWIEPQNQLLYNRIAPFREFSSLDSPLTDLLNVKYILTEEEIPLPKYALVYEDASIRVYENLGVAPRAFTLPLAATLVVPDVEAVGDAVQTHDPRFHAIVEAADVADVALPVGTPESARPTAQPVTHYGENEVWIDVHTDGAAWLVLTDAYAPGWKAFARPPGAADSAEVELPIARIAGNFRGVQLTESATVRFKYTPDSVKIGAFTSFLAGMVMIFLAIVWGWRLIYREHDDDSTVQRLAKNSLAPIVLTLFNRAVDFAFAALMLRVLGPANAGDYYYAVSTFMWFDIITNFGLNTYLTREVSRHREDARRYLLNTTALRLGLGVIALPLLIGFVVVRQTAIAALTQPASTQAIIAIGLLYLGVLPNSISTGLSALFYGFEKAEYPAALTTFSTLIKVTVGVLTLMLGWGVVGLAGGAIVVNLITLAVLGGMAWQQFPQLRKAPPQSPPSGGKALRREMIHESWPLMVNHLLAVLFFKIDVFLMEPILGSAVLGPYSVGYKFLDALNVIPSMFTLALFPVISRQARDNRAGLIRFYRLSTKILISLVLPSALMATLAAREMVLILGGAEYLPGAMIALQWMAWSMPLGWINSLTQYVLIAVDQQRYLTRAHLWGFSFTLVANLLLMPRFGYQASAALHIFSELALFIPFVIGVRRYLGDVGWRDLLSKPLLIAALSGGVMLALLPINRWLALGMGLLAYPLLVWRLGLFTPEEAGMLTSLWRKR